MSFFFLGCIQTEKQDNNHSGLTGNDSIYYREFCKAPNCRYFIKEKINWDKEYQKQNIDTEDESASSFPTKVGLDMLDTMFILTDKKLILIKGQYSYYRNDTIRMPQSGEFGINFNVMDKGKYQIGQTTKITFNKADYILCEKLEYQWWCLIRDKLETNKDNSITVSGP